MASSSEARFANALGWFSLGLGVATLASPRSVARMIGVRDDGTNREALMAVGLREIASGLGILTSRQPAGWLWARTGGDIMDLSLLSAAFTEEDAQRERLALTTLAIVGITAVDFMASQQASRQQTEESDWSHQISSNGGNGMRKTGRSQKGGLREVRKSITINRPAQELYDFWHDFENLPRFMKHVESVRVSEDGLRSHWKASAPAGMSVEWDAEMVDDQPGQRIAWRSLENADVKNAGMVQFLPATDGRGTVVQVELHYDPPGGALGAAFAKLFGEEPEMQIREDLRRFKQVMETGEIVVSDGTLVRADRLLMSGERPAQSPSEKQLAEVEGVRGATIAEASANSPTSRAATGA